MTEERFLVEASKPASPIVIPTAGCDQIFPGLSKKEYFAGLAMQGLLACPETLISGDPKVEEPADVAKLAVAHAEALLWELGGVQ